MRILSYFDFYERPFLTKSGDIFPDFIDNAVTRSFDGKFRETTTCENVRDSLLSKNWVLISEKRIFLSLKVYSDYFWSHPDDIWSYHQKTGEKFRTWSRRVEDFLTILKKSVGGRWLKNFNYWNEVFQILILESGCKELRTSMTASKVSALPGVLPHSS